MTDSNPAVDLEIRVRTEIMESRTLLTYVLDSPSGAVDPDPVSIPSEPFTGSPDAYQAALIKKIELLHEGFDIDGSPLLNREIKSKLEGVGRDLYHELFPPPMRELYREIRTRVRTLLIVSDEPWIPWELVKPYDDTRPDELIDDDFLCGRFRLTRWLSGGKAAPPAIAAGKVACVDGGEPPEAGSLPCAAEESALIASLAESQPRVVDVSPSTATYEDVEKLLKTRALGLLHIVSHGEFVEDQPNESRILLADGRSFRATDLHGPTATRISANRPLVFLNACRVARQGWSLTGLGGWVERWVRRCACGCLVAPQWVVNDELAYEFARIFYRELAKGESFGEATWKARRRVREIDPGDPTWLAYSVFAHPGGRIVFAQDQMQGNSLTDAELPARGVTPRESQVRYGAAANRDPLPAPPAPYLAHRYTLLQTRSLVGRNTELDHLTDWVSNPGGETFQARVFNVVAIGGMGKSALAWKWFQEISARKMRPLAGRVWWSFYEHDATFERFVVQTLAYVSGRSASAVQEMPPPDREEQLLTILDQRPFLVVLDGLERIMIAYARMDAARMMDDDLDEKTANVVAETMDLPESAADSFVRQHRLRKTQDPRAGAFFRKLADLQASRFLVTTRLYPAELQDPFTGRPVPGSIPYFLEGLRGADSLKLWRALGIRGKGHLILPILDRVEHHPLVIRALAGEVAGYRRAPGDFDRWLEAHPDFDPSRQLPLVQVRSHVLAFALRGLREPSHRVAQTIAAFRMPAGYDALSAVLVAASQSGFDEPELNAALADLEDRGLTGWDREANQYDMHPLVRGVIWSQLENSDKQVVYEGLQAHFEAIPAIYQYQVVDSGMLTPAIELCNALVNLKHYDDAYQIYHTRIHDADSNYLNSYQAVEILELFFPSGADRPPALSKKSCREEAMVYLADAYRANGQLARASLTLRCLVQTSKDAGDLSAMAFGLRNLSDSLLPLGSIREAEESIRCAADTNRNLKLFSRVSGDVWFLGRILLYRGEDGLARRVFNHERAQVFGIDAALAECALWLGDAGAANAFAGRAWEATKACPVYERSEKYEIRILCLKGRAMIELGDPARAEECLRQSLVRARNVNDIEGEVEALIALAEAVWRRGGPDAARELLEVVWEPVERGPFALLHADARNLLAQIEAATDNSAAAIEAAETAFRLAWCDGPPFAYHWGLSKARSLVRSLGGVDPEMPPFEEGRHRSMEGVDIFSGHRI